MKLLEALCEAELQRNGGLISSSRALRAFLLTRPEVLAVSRALASGEVTTSDLDAYVRERLRSFSPGEKFEYEIALAAIVVVLESFPGPFAEAYLLDLANLRIEEIPMATRVASLCLQRRREVVPGLTSKTTEFESGARAGSAGLRLQEALPPRSAIKTDENRFNLMAG